MLLFLGSGVSRASGIPSVADISKRLLGDDLPESRRRTDGRPGTTGQAQHLLRLLAGLDGHYLDTIAPWPSGKHYKYTGSIYRKHTSYEDLFHLTEQITQTAKALQTMHKLARS